MKYLNKFDTKSDYQASASTLEIPNVAYITATTEVIYNATVKTYIVFADPLVEEKCVQLYSSDGIGCTEEDLAAVSALSASDWSGSNITSFDELEYFTGLTTINAYTFQNCTGLTSVTIPDSVTSIGNSAFAGCNGLTSVTVPDSVTVLEQRVFQSCGHLVSMTLPSGLTAINQYLFANDTNLTAVTIPSGVTSIGIYAFGNCPALSAITFEAATPPASISNLAFDNAPTTGNITVPVGSEANYYDLARTLGVGWTVNNYIRFTDSVVQQKCVQLYSSDGIGCTKADLAAVTSLNASDWSGTSIGGLSDLQLFTGLASIPQGCFKNCTDLSNAIIPDSVTAIGQEAFQGCSSLNNLRFMSTTPPATVGTDAFSGLPTEGILIIPTGSYSNDWRSFMDQNLGSGWQSYYPG